MMKSHPKAQTLQKSRKFILRPYRRVPTRFPSHYMSSEMVGTAIVTNLSFTGLRMLGDHTVTPGTELAVRFTLEEKKPPIEIAHTTVRWIDEFEFGLQIDSISPAAAESIAALMDHHIRVGRPR